MPRRVSPPDRLKAPIRALAGRVGYDIVPSRQTGSEFTRGLLENRRPEVILDIGANQGQYAHQLRRLGFEGAIHSFEPQNRAYALLESYSRSDENWHPYKMALGAAAGNMPLHVSRNSVSSSLLPVTATHINAAPASRTYAEEFVPVMRLDDFLPVAEHAAGGAPWVKVDVQGYELEVLTGATQWLSEATVVQCELSLRVLYEGQASYKDVIAFVEEFGFELRRIDTAFEDIRTGETLQIDGVFVRP